MQSKQLNIDRENLVKSARIPLIVAAIMGLSWLIGISFGSFWGIIFTLIWALAGAMYTRTVLNSGAGIQLPNLAVNGGLLGGTAAVVYQIASWLALSIRHGGQTLDLGNMLFSFIEAAFVGVLGALSWYAYKTEKPEQP